MNRHLHPTPGSDAAGSSPPRGRARRGSRIAAVLAVLGTLALITIAVDRARTGVSAQPGAAARAALPAGWSLSPDGRRLTWSAPAPLPLTDAYHLVHVNDRTVIPAAVAPDRRRASVPVPAGQEVSDPKLVAGGQRLDAPEPAGPGQRLAPAAPPPVPLPALPAADDPGTPGPFRTQEGEYDEPAVPAPGLAVPVEMRAVVVAPQGAPGPRPVAVFVHGGHSTCFVPGSVKLSPTATAWPCPAGQREVPSYRGYRESQRLLASQGWITLSISANGVNGQTNGEFVAPLDPAARAGLVRTHLDRWAVWNGIGRATAPAIVRAAGNADLDRTLLVGHSRGGEAVNRVATVSATEPVLPWRVRGQLLIAPVALAHDPAPGIPTALLLASCDGDVSDLQGQAYVDAARDRYTLDPALRSSVFVDGANHNFFNREWTPGVATDQSSALDDAVDDYPGDPACGAQAPTRLTDAEQRTVGAVYTAAAAQALVLRNPAVAPLFDGTPVRADSAGDVRIVAHALGGHRHELLVPTPTTDVTGEAGVTASRCATTRPAGSAGACLSDDIFPAAARAPHFGSYVKTEDEPTRTALALTWAATGGKARVKMTGAAIVADATAVTMRVIVPPQAVGTSFATRVVDRGGRSFELGTTTLNGVPVNASALSGISWAREARIPLDRAAALAAGVDLLRLDHLEIVPRSPRGQLWLLDAWGYRAGLVDAPPGPFPRYDIPNAITEPGDEDRTVALRVPVRGRLLRPAAIYVNVNNAATGRILTVPAGADHFTIDVPLAGDDIDTDAVSLSIRTIPVSGISTVESQATVLVEDDEPTPPLSFNTTASAVEGSVLRWTFRLPRPSGRALVLQARFAAPVGSTELRARDLTSEQLALLGYTGELDVPLSQTGIVVNLMLSPGETSASIELAVAADRLREGTEAVRLVTVPPVLMGVPMQGSTPGVPIGSTFTGTVTDR
jgi:hypothetical protein